MTEPLVGHMHPSYTAYKDGCRCDRCVTYSRRKRKEYRVYGTIRVSAADALTKLDQLIAEGYPVVRIAEAAGVPRPTLKQIVQIRRPRINRDTAERLAKVTRAQIIALAPPGAHLPITGTQRRIHALARLGWTFRQMADNDPAMRKVIGDISRGHRQHITAAHYFNIKNIYDRLHMTIGPSTRTRIRAVRAGWASPLAWGDIDNPAAKPDTGETEDTAEQREQERHALWERGLTDREIGAAVGRHHDAIRRWRLRHGLPHGRRSA